MNSSVTCKKVTSLLALYIDNKLDSESMDFVTQHLEVCPECHKKYVTLKNLINELRSAYKELVNETKAQEKKIQFNIKEYEKFHTNLSAYFDNELPLNESVNMKKYMIKFPNARKNLEEMYNLHKIISSSFVYLQKSFNDDYSRAICYRIQGKSPDFKKQIYLKAASFAGALILLGALIGSTLPVGKTVIERGVKFFKKTIYVQAPNSNDLVSEKG